MQLSRQSLKNTSVERRGKLSFDYMLIFSFQNIDMRHSWNSAELQRSVVLKFFQFTARRKQSEQKFPWKIWRTMPPKLFLVLQLEVKTIWNERKNICDLAKGACI